MRCRRPGGSLLLVLLELLECPIAMTSYLVRRRLRKRLGLVAGASRDRQEDKGAYDHSGPELLHAALSMVHSRRPFQGFLIFR